MNAVSDRADRYLILPLARVEPLPHTACHMAVEFAHPVVVSGATQRQGGHGEGRSPLLLLEGDLHELVAGEAELRPVAPEELLDHGEREGVVTCRHRRVSGKDALGPYLLECLLKRLPLGYKLAAEFENQEGRVPLIHMPDRRLVAELAQGADAPHTEDELLRDAHLLVATVEARRELAILWAVGVDIRIHQQQLDTPNPKLVDLGVDRASRELYLNHYLVATGIESGNRRYVGEVDLVVLGKLPTTRVEPLTEVALGVDEAHGDKGQPHIRGLFDMVARKDP